MESQILARYNRPVPRYTSYPTAPHFTPAIGAADYRRWLTAVSVDTPLSLYVHIPFCDTLCWFCGCHTKIVRRYEPVARYLDLLIQELELLATALGPGHTLGHLHFGGGSPTILQADDVARFLGRLRSDFSLSPNAEFAVEIDPRDITNAQIDAWAAAGMNRVSLGVQDLDPTVQAAINRHQSLAETAAVVARCRQAGVTGVNIDLMYGLPHQTVAGVIDTARQILTLAPDRLALFGYAHVPWMKKHQRLIPEASLPDTHERLRQSEAARDVLLTYGYQAIGLDHFARPDDPLALAQAAGRLNRNFQGYTTDCAEVLLGVGASAIGALPQGYVQNEPDLRRYAATLASGSLPVVRGIAIDDEDRLRRAVIERLMCDLAVDLPAICAGFGMPLDHFASLARDLDAVAADGLIRFNGDRLELTEKGRPFLRSVCTLFDSYLQAGQARHSRVV